MVWYKLTRATDGHDYIVKYQGTQALDKQVVGPEANDKIKALEACRPHHVIVGDYAMDVSIIGTRLWYPSAKTLKDQPTKGDRPNGIRGLCIHYPVWFSGAHKVDQLNDICINNGHSYMICDEKGQMYQGAPLNRWGWHTGKAAWRKLPTPLSAELLGVEVCSWGRMQDLSASLKRYVDKSRVKVLKNDRDNAPAGEYESFTNKQIASIVSLCFWLKDNYPEFSFDNVVGHSEISPGRKADPGGCMELSMQQFRNLLKVEYQKLRG